MYLATGKASSQRGEISIKIAVQENINWNTQTVHLRVCVSRIIGEITIIRLRNAVSALAATAAKRSTGGPCSTYAPLASR